MPAPALHCSQAPEDQQTTTSALRVYSPAQPGVDDMTEQDTVWLTKDAYEKLRAELENLKGPLRQEVIDRIAAARDEGDLKENGGYHAAKDEQGKMELRIRQ